MVKIYRVGTLADLTASTHVEISRDGRVIGVATWEEYRQIPTDALAGVITRPLTQSEAMVAIAQWRSQSA